MDVSSASLSTGSQAQFNPPATQAQLQVVEQQMQQELALIEAMAGAAPNLAASPPAGVGTVVDVTA